MKKDIHPEAFVVTALCACGNSFQTSSAVETIKTTLCSACHPFFTGKHKFADTAGRIERFQSKYKKFEEQKAKPKSEKKEQQKKK